MSIASVTARVQQIVVMQQQLTDPVQAASASTTAAVPSAASGSLAASQSFAASLAAAQTASPSTALTMAAAVPPATATTPTAPTPMTGVGASTNPVPGATGSRLDQGLDGTASTFVAPFSGTVVYAAANDPGWNGGGYLAVRSATDPSKVFYAAEGLVPTVKAGDTVTAGQQIAQPVVNPYNGITGNFEIGWANPNSPSQPLAQVTPDPRQEVLGFYGWLRSLGGPIASSTNDAGHG